MDMVADVSGSMSGTPLSEAQMCMANFVNSMQFDAGDQVELTSFATGVRLEQEFTDDASSLIDEINDLVTGDMTSLYDALYTAVERVATQSGARCVIAFTDGNDNYSDCSGNRCCKCGKQISCSCVYHWNRICGYNRSLYDYQSDRRRIL